MDRTESCVHPCNLSGQGTIDLDTAQGIHHCSQWLGYGDW